MARIKRRGESGAAKNYVTRNQAIRKLQISLADFRKLCIWKGIYPREPRSKKKVSKSSTSSTTFYYYKDIQFLLHEPLLQNFRDQKALEKKISKALGRGDVKDAARLDSNAAHPEKTGKSHYTLDHIVRERYPTFVDALRDLDDCLSMLFLFASLPSTSSVPAKMIARCERLCLEFQHYAIVSHSLTKSFLSIKGIYYQANIQGEEVLWLAPYKFTQRVVGDVDYRIMGTFVEFYMTLLGFVNFRLYTSIGLKYPPRFDLVKDENAAELGALTLEGKTLVGGEDQKQLEGIAHRPDPSIQAAINKVVESLVSDNTNGKGDEASKERDEEKEQDGSGAIDKFESVIPGGDVLLQPSTSSSGRGTLFSDFTFYLSRETPRQPLEFILKAFGCKRVGWDATLGDGAFTTDELDASITHQIVDRAVIQAAGTTEGETEDNQTAKKLTQNQRIPGRTYIQPQWVWDSINDCELKESHMYAPGASLPPHISPFVKSVPGAYDPTLPLEDQEMNHPSFDLDSDEEVGTDDAGKGMDVTDDDDKQDDDKEDDEPGEDDEISEEDEEDEDPNDENEAAEREEELKAELTGVSIKPSKSSTKTKDKNDAHNSLSKKSREEMEDINRAKGMLSKKKRKLFEQMQYTNNKKNIANEKLLAKRRRLEKDKAKKL